MVDHGWTEEEFASRLDWGLWRRILGHVRPYRRTAAALALVSTGIAAIEALYTLLTRAVVDGVASGATESRLATYGAAYAALTLGLAGGVRLFVPLAGRIATGVGHDIRRAGFDRLQELSFSYYDRRPVGWLMARLTSDCDRLARLIGWGALESIWAVAMIAGIVAVMAYLNARLALAVLAVIPVMVGVSAAFQRRILRASRLVRKANSLITGAYNEGILGARTTKTLVREDRNLAEFQGRTCEMYGASVRSAVLASLYFPIVLALGSVGSGVALALGGRDVRAGTMSIGTLIAFVMYAAHFIWPILELARVFTDLQAAQAAAERVQGLLDTEPEIRDAPAVREAEAARRAGRPPGQGAGARGDPIETVEFRDVAFAYREGRPVLEGFDLAVRAGQTVALVGPTGGGKTTVVSLLCRFYEPTRGQVLLNGVDYRERSLAWLQSQLGVVLQTPHLFTGTIRDNLRYGRLDAADAEVEAAARLVGAHDFIAALEKGYASPVGPGGANLSTGQRQLVALARAVLADPRLFVMDEATSSVDTQTEHAIQEGIRTVLAGRIAFVIAHRLSTIRSADVIVVIEKGRIVEQGGHRDLLARRGKYYELYVSQFTREKEDELLGPAAKA